MDFEELKLKAREDLKLSDDLDQDAQDLPRRKAQWSEWLSVFSIAYKKAEWRLFFVKKERFEYYYSNYTITLDKRDIRETYIPGDEEVIKAAKALELQKQKVELCERTLRGLNSMGFDIKNVIEYRKLMSGIV